MGIVCDYCRVKDETIDYFANHPDEAREFFETNYFWVTGKYHTADDTVFSTDKAWDIAKFLIKECDTTPDKILNEIDGKTFDEKEGLDSLFYIKSDKVKKINFLLRKISEKNLLDAYDQNKLIEKGVYSADLFGLEHWRYILGHFQTMQKAFAKAEECDDGLVINYG